MTVEAFRFKLPLHRPLFLRGKQIMERTGFLVRLQDAGHVGWGEASPLPYFSLETEDDVLDVCKRICRDGLPDKSRWSLLPFSMRFALEGAQLDLQASIDNSNMAEVLNGSWQRSLSVNGLLLRGQGEVMAQAQKLVDAGYTTLKLKVGGKSVKDDAETVQHLLGVLPPNCTLRLDANRAWSLDEAIAFSGYVDMTRIEYLEEPLNDPSQLRKLVETKDLPIALDESLTRIKLADLEDCDFVSALVLKPTILGGLERSRMIASEAVSMGLKVVISSSFELGIGMRTLVALAASIRPVAVSGLSTYSWIDDVVLEQPITEFGATIYVPDVLNAREINMSNLERIG